MARQIRIDALAEQCGVAPREILRILIELGQFRYSRFSQQVGDDLAEQVRARLAPATVVAPQRPAGPLEEDLFAQAMSAAGVKRLDGRSSPSKGPKKRKLSKVKGRGAPKTAPVATPQVEPAIVPTVEPVSAPALEPVPTPAVESAPVPAARAEAVLAGLAEVGPAPTAPEREQGTVDNDCCAELQAKLSTLEGQLAKLHDEHQHASQQLHALSTERDELQASSAILATAGPLPGVADGATSLLALLQERGLRGIDEAGFALRALLSAHLLDNSLPLLVSVDSGRMRRVLGERLCLCCGREACGEPRSVEHVRVPEQRCELCGGQALPRVHHLFSDACLLSGITRVLVYGGRKWHQAWLDAGKDPRVQLRARASGLLATDSALDHDLNWAQFVVIWDDGGVHPELLTAIQQRRSEALATLVAGSMGELMAQAASFIEGLDPSELP